MRNYERSIARGAAISTSIKTSADCNSTRKRAAINRKYIAHQCVRQLTRDYNYAHVHMTPRVPCVLIRLCALLKRSLYVCAEINHVTIACGNGLIFNISRVQYLKIYK